MSEFFEHNTRISGWRDGRFVVHPEAGGQDCTVWAWFDWGDEGKPVWEGLLARRTADDRAVILAAPLWTYDLHLLDEVRVIESDGDLLLDGVHAASGHETFRVAFDDAAADDAWQALAVALEPHGAWVDVHTERFLAVAVDGDHAGAVADELRARAKRGELQFEPGARG